MRKRRILGGLLAVLCLLTVVRAASEEDGQTLVSLSYLNGPFLASLEEGMRARAKQDTQAVYDAALEQLDAVGQAHAEAPESWTASGTPRPAALDGADVVTLAQGGTLLWLAGSGRAGPGLVDATAGSEVPDGGLLQTGHRYLNALVGDGSETETAVNVTVLSDAASAALEGRWRVAESERSGTGFYDLCESDWFYPQVRWAVDEGVFVGVSATQFNPRGTVNRATIATLLCRLEGREDAEYQGTFSDVPPGQWYTAGIEWASQAGVVLGNGNGTFTPFSNATREQIAVMLCRYAQYLGLDTSASASLDAYPDRQAVHSWAEEALSWAVGTGIIQGSDGYLLPQSNATRAQTAIMLQRFQALRGLV